MAHFNNNNNINSNRNGRNGFRVKEEHVQGRKT